MVHTPSNGHSPNDTDAATAPLSGPASTPTRLLRIRRRSVATLINRDSNTVACEHLDMTLVRVVDSGSIRWASSM